MSLIGTYVASSITINNRTGQGADGRATFGASTSTTARVLDKSGVVRGKEGNDLTYDRVIHLKPTETIAVRDKITYDGVAHEVVFLREGRDIGNTLDHYKAMVVRLG